MTIDLQAEALCDHRVHRESYVIDFVVDPDFRVIRLQQPISSDDVRVWFNDVEVFKDDEAFGWSLQKDELSAEEDPKKKIVFKRPIREFFGVFDVSYSTRIELCRKCFGLGLLYDHSLDSTGTFRTVENEQKLIQGMVKFLMTKLSSNPFFTWIGSSIPDVILQGIFNPDLLESQLLTDVSAALQRLKNIQFHQAKVQVLTLKELLDDIISVDVIQDTQDPRIFEITVSASTAAGNEVLIKRELVLGEKFSSLPTRQAGIV
jgi:hypothetical protein